jgi:hypothetical protein
MTASENDISGFIAFFGSVFAILICILVYFVKYLSRKGVFAGSFPVFTV